MSQQFLYLPFQSQKYKITEGWRYSEQENSIHGFKGHGTVDFELPRGTPVLAAAGGFAIASYFCLPVKNEDGTPRLYQNKAVGMGLGYFVQIYHPEQKLYSTYGHLEKIAPEIKFLKPRKVGEKFWPVGHKLAVDVLATHALVTPVKAGQLIGFAGDSGLTLGYSDYPKRPDPDKFPSWDEVHLHFEVFERFGSKKRKKYFDPYGIKGDFQDYPDSFKKGQVLGEKSKVLWILAADGLPKFFGS